MGRHVSGFQFRLYRFYHHNGIIHHRTDSKHECKERQQVDGKTGYSHKCKRTDDGHKDGNGRNQSSLPVLQEEVNHQDHQDDSQYQGKNHLFDRSIEEIVHRHHRVYHQTLRHGFTRFFYQGINIVHYLGRIGTGNLENHHFHSRMPVCGRFITIRFNAQFDVGNVFQTKHFPIRQCLNNHLAEFLGCLLTSGILHDVFVGRTRTFTERTGSRLDVLFGKHANHIRRHQMVVCHGCRIEPDTHTVLVGKEYHATYSLDTLQLRFEVNLGVVGQELVVVTALRSGMKVDYLNHTVLTLDDRHSDTGHFGRQGTCRLCHTVLHEHGCHVGIHSLTEINHDFHVTGVGCRRSDVVHVFHPVDGFFQRSNDRLLYRLGRCTRIGCHHHDGRRSNIWELFDGERLDTDHPHQNYHNGNNRRKYRPFNECP